MGFASWSSVVEQVYRYQSIILTGGDSSKRHNISKLQLTLLKHIHVLTKSPIDGLDDLGIVYNPTKELIKVKDDFNMINTLGNKYYHFSHAKAYNLIGEFYPEFIKLIKNRSRGGGVKVRRK